MDNWLEAIALHDSLHGCCNGRGTGTVVIKAKLTQQLAHIEQAPFYGVCIDLKKNGSGALPLDIGGAWRRLEHAQAYPPLFG